jgi:uncharacterized protein YggE
MNFKHTIFAYMLFGTVVLHPLTAKAQTSNEAFRANLPSRIVTTSGTGTVQAAPDRVFLSVGVKIWNKDLNAAYALNEDKSRNLLALAPQFNISPKNVQTDSISVEATYPPHYGATTSADEIPTGYVVDQGVIFVLDDIKKLRELITKAVESGANQIRSIEFDTSNLRQLKDEARILALKAAKEKAEAMAHEYSAKLGKVVVMQEVGTSIQGLSSNRYTYFPNLTNNIRSSSTSESFEMSNSVAPGQLKITSSVSTTFELTE